MGVCPQARESWSCSWEHRHRQGRQRSTLGALLTATAAAVEHFSVRAGPGSPSDTVRIPCCVLIHCEGVARASCEHLLRVGQDGRQTLRSSVASRALQCLVSRAPCINHLALFLHQVLPRRDPRAGMSGSIIRDRSVQLRQLSLGTFHAPHQLPSPSRR